MFDEIPKQENKRMKTWRVGFALCKLSKEMQWKPHSQDLILLRPMFLTRYSAFALSWLNFFFFYCWMLTINMLLVGRDLNSWLSYHSNPYVSPPTTKPPYDSLVIKLVYRTMPFQSAIVLLRTSLANLGNSRFWDKRRK